MTATDFVAWYAAAVSTAVALWDFYKWRNSGAKLRVRAFRDICYPDSRVTDESVDEKGQKSSTLAAYGHVEIVNGGLQPTTLMDVQAVCKQVSGGQGFVAYSVFQVHSGSHALPTVIAPGHLWSARIEMSHIESLASRGEVKISVKASHCEKPLYAAITKRRI